MEETDQLVRGIFDVFPEKPRPRGSLFVALEEGSPFAVDLQRAFSGRTWTSLTGEELWLNFDAMFWAKPRVWKYYLPAFLVEAIRGRDSTCGNDVSTGVFYSFMAKSGGERERLRARLSLLNREQVDVLRRVILHISKSESQEHARKVLQLIDDLGGA